MRLVLFVVAFFIVEIFFLSSDLKFDDSKKSDLDNIKVEFTSSKSYFISPVLIDKMLIADKIQQGSSFKKFIKPVLTFYDGNLTKTIVCNDAFLNENTNMLTLNKNINMAYGNYILKSSKLLYDVKKQVITDSAMFNLQGINIDATGNHLYFDIKKSIIKAQNIRYIITSVEK